jgi:Coenzyme PQQ synthesis protein D (PqqD)
VRRHVNRPDVIHETIDGEVVVINLTTGAYYSLSDTAGEIWGLLHAGVANETVATALLRRYDGALDELAPVVDRFVAELCADQLLVPDDDVRSGVAAGGDPSDVLRGPFKAPRLEKFTDMEHLITLDPVHEVDPERGWPNTP